MGSRFRFILIITNALLFTLALFFLALLALYKTTPEKFDGLGDWRINSYTSKGENLKNEALSALQAGRSDKAVSLLDNWSWAQNGDRYYQLKREVFVALSEFWTQDGSYQSIVDASEPFINSDERDLIVFSIWAKAALKLPESRDLAETEVLDKWKSFPGSALISELYLNHVYDWSDKGDALKVLSSSAFSSSSVKTTGWFVYWSDTPGFSQKQFSYAPLQGDSNSRALKVKVSKTTKFLRIDPPPEYLVDLKDFVVSVAKNTQTIPMNKVRNVRMAEVSGGVLKTDGGNDPHLTLVLNEDLFDGVSGDFIEVTISFKASSRPPNWVSARLSNMKVK